MTQEQKDLLLKDLCARLSYGVKVESVFINPDTKEHKSCGIEVFDATSMLMIRDGLGEFKPYLFPLSSMTDKQIMESPISIQVCDLENLRYDSVWTELNDRFPDLIDLIDWLNKNHFDYRGLIPMGLAIDATGLNIY